MTSACRCHWSTLTDITGSCSARSWSNVRRPISRHGDFVPELRLDVFKTAPKATPVSDSEDSECTHPQNTRCSRNAVNACTCSIEDSLCSIWYVREISTSTKKNTSGGANYQAKMKSKDCSSWCAAVPFFASRECCLLSLSLFLPLVSAA